MKPRKKNNFNIKQKLNELAIKTPYFLVFVLMVIISPLGVYFFVVKNKKDKKKMHINGKNLISVGMFVIFLIVIGIYSKVKEIIELLDSGMSLDMLNFVPDNFFLYIVGIIVVITYILGGKKLIKRSKIEQIYTYKLNIEHNESIDELSKELNVSVQEVISDIKLLQRFGYLVPLEINIKTNKIIYEKEDYKKFKSNKKQNAKREKCSKCGTLILLKKDEYNECDFCGYGMIDEDK